MDKSPDAFRTISEVAELLDTPAHVLRFWESRFPQIKPVKRAGGRRYYRPVDVDLLIGIRKLLHDEGLTIRGVQKVLREQGVRHVSGLSEDDNFDEEPLTVIPAAAQRSSAPIPLFPAAKQAADETPVLHPEPPQNEPLVASPTALSDDVLPPFEVTEDAIDLGADVAGSAPTSQPQDDEAAEDMRKTPTTASPDPNAPELPFDPPAEKPADALLQTDSPLEDEDSADTGNIFVEGESEAEVDEPEEASATGSASKSQEADSLEAVSTIAEPALPAQIAEPASESLSATSDSDSVNDGDTMPDAAPSVPDAADHTLTAPDSAAPLKHPLPVLDASEIHAEWLPADLRGLRAGAFGAKHPEAAALLQRLQALRNRVGDLGRVPRR